MAHKIPKTVTVKCQGEAEVCCLLCCICLNFALRNLFSFCWIFYLFALVGYWLIFGRFFVCVFRWVLGGRVLFWGFFCSAGLGVFLQPREAGGAILTLQSSTQPLSRVSSAAGSVCAIPPTAPYTYPTSEACCVQAMRSVQCLDTS